MDDEQPDTTYVTPKKAKEFLGVSDSTLRLWDEQNKIKTIRTPSGTRLYDLQSIHGNSNTSKTVHKIEKERIVYCRVSSKHQNDDLERQKDFFRSKYPNHNVVSDIGSGLNWKRAGLKTILERSMSGNLEEVVVAHRDRLSRFAFELIEFILERNGTKLIVLDAEHGKSKQTELAEDVLSIIHVFSCREMGKRRYSKEKKEEAS